MINIFLHYKNLINAASISLDHSCFFRGLNMLKIDKKNAAATAYK